MQKRIEQYLNQATRGLWGKKRQQVKQELYSHIYEKMQFHLSFGQPEEEALKSALQALGKPAEINTGLLKTHTFPALTKSLLLAGLLGGFLVSQAQNQKMIGFHQKSEVCTTQTCSGGPVTFIEADALMQTLAEQNIPATLKVEFNNGALLTLPNMHSIYFNPLNTFQKEGKLYLSFEELITTLSIETDFKIRHLKNPEVTFNTTTFRAGDQRHPFDATRTYQNLIAPDIYNRTGATLISGPAVSALQIYALSIKVPDAQEGEVYALLQPAPAHLYDSSLFQKAFTIQYAEADQGTLNFKSVSPQVKFSSLEHGSPGTVLLKITGKINYWKSLPPFEGIQPLANQIFYP